MHRRRDDKLYVIETQEARVGRDLRRLTFRTTCGDFEALAHISKGMSQAVLMLGGRAGGFDGPGSAYLRLSERLGERGIGSVRLGYRSPGECAKCAIDALVALQYLDDSGIPDVALLGWSLGGAVAIAVGAVARTVSGVAVIATLDIASCCVRRLGSTPLLVIHGAADAVSGVDVARRIHAAAEGPRELVVYPDAGHRMTGAGDRLCEDLLFWFCAVLRRNQAAA